MAVPTSVISEQMDMEHTCCVLCYMHHMEYFLTSSKPSTTSTWGVNRHSPACQSLWNINDSASCDLNRFDAYHFVSIDTDVLSHGLHGLHSHSVSLALPSGRSPWGKTRCKQGDDFVQISADLHDFDIFDILIFWCVPSDTNSCEVWRNRVHV